ncbi:MAG: RNA polymerase sigma factor [Syntrophotaleaceae bacterium]
MNLNAAATVIDPDRLAEVSEVLETESVLTEQILLDQIRSGHPLAFEQLVQAKAPQMINLAYRLVGNREEAEDIAQEAFLKMHRTLDTFRGECSLSSWLYRIVSRLAIDHLRREKLRRKLFFFRQSDEEADPLELVPDSGPSSVDILQARETESRLKQALKRLSGRQRAVFVLRHQEGLPLKEIAAVLQLEEGTVKAHLHRAVRVLRVELQDLHEDQP